MIVPRCSGFKPDGAPCERIVGASQRFCFSHDPARKDERRRNASRAGRSRPGGELGEIQSLLREITDRVLDGGLDSKVAAVAGQILNTRLRGVEISRRLAEQQELIDRLEALEERAGFGHG